MQAVRKKDETIAFRDPVSSLLLAIIFILAIQRLHNEKINNINKPVASAPAAVDLSSVVSPDVNYNSATNDGAQITGEQNIGAQDPSSASRFTTDRQFLEAQSNIIPNSSYMSQVKTFETQFGAQGLDDGVQGYDSAYSNNLTQQASVFSL